MADQLNANLGDETGNAVIGKQNTQTVATDSPMLTASPQIYVGGPTSFDMIMLTLAQQNNVLSRLESKFDSHFVAVDIRFKALEKVTTTVEIAIGTIQDKLRIMDRTNAELEHASTVRGQQSAALETQIREVKGQQVELNHQLEIIETALAQAQAQAQTQAAATAQTVATAQEQARRPDNRSRLMFALFVAALAIITALNFYFMWSTGK